MAAAKLYDGRTFQIEIITEDMDAHRPKNGGKFHAGSQEDTEFFGNGGRLRICFDGIVIGDRNARKTDFFGMAQEFVRASSSHR